MTSEELFPDPNYVNLATGHFDYGTSLPPAFPLWADIGSRYLTLYEGRRWSIDQTYLSKYEDPDRHNHITISSAQADWDNRTHGWTEHTRVRVALHHNTLTIMRLIASRFPEFAVVAVL